MDESTLYNGIVELVDVHGLLQHWHGTYVDACEAACVAPRTLPISGACCTPNGISPQPQPLSCTSLTCRAAAGCAVVCCGVSAAVNDRARHKKATPHATTARGVRPVILNYLNQPRPEGIPSSRAEGANARAVASDLPSL